MSKEQWIIYLYDVWPEEGTMILLLMFFVASVITVIAIYIEHDNAKEYNRRLIYDEDKIDLNSTLWVKVGRIKYVVPTVLFMLMFILGFLPSKNAFIAIVATPTLLESLESGRLSKVNKLIDLGLDRAIEELKDNK